MLKDAVMTNPAREVTEASRIGVVSPGRPTTDAGRGKR